MNQMRWLFEQSWWPTQLSAHAATVDEILVALCVVLVLLVAPVFIVMTWFAIRYRKGSPASRHGRPKGSPWIETAWSLIPLAIVLVFFVRAADAFIDLHADTAGALQVAVVAKQWMWKVEHPTGRRQINQLNVPAGTPVELTMISQDVIHSMYLPALRIKQDVLPGRYTKLRFTAERTGTYHITCAEYCGTLHARMSGTLVVMTRADYTAWANSRPQFVPAAQAGRRLYASLQCDACHTADTAAPAPDLHRAAGRLVQLEDGRSVRADDDYLRDAILWPNRAVVAGYRPVMPSYRNQLDERQIRSLIAYLHDLADGGEHR